MWEEPLIPSREGTSGSLYRTNMSCSLREQLLSKKINYLYILLHHTCLCLPYIVGGTLDSGEGVYDKNRPFESGRLFVWMHKIIIAAPKSIKDLC